VPKHQPDTLPITTSTSNRGGMLDISTQSPSVPAIPALKQAKTLTVNGKNRVAIEAMVWDGLTRAEAAEKAGLKDHALYCALAKPHVKAFYLRQLEVLRTSERARNIHTLVEVHR
jgi:hypothetical protein